jgi:hypothetical protein
MEGQPKGHGDGGIPPSGGWCEERIFTKSKRKKTATGACVAAMPPACPLANGFTLYILEAVMNGRGDELVDLAVSNMWL